MESFDEEEEEELSDKTKDCLIYCLTPFLMLGFITLLCYILYLICITLQG